MIAHVNQGSDMDGLMAYLGGRGHVREGMNEHTDQRLIDASEPILAEYGTEKLDHTEALEVASKLDQTKRLAGKAPAGGHVYHASLSIPKEDETMPDKKWKEIAREYLRKTGFISQPDAADAPYAVVHHGPSGLGNDHVHIAASMVRKDGTVISPWGFKRNAQKAAREIEREFDLTTKLAQGYGTQGVTAAEHQRMLDRGLAEPERVTLARVVRGAAESASTERDFVLYLRERGVLVRPFIREGEVQVSGYSVAARPEPGEKPVYFSGRKLGHDLGLGVLRKGWEQGSGDIVIWENARQNIPVYGRPDIPSTEQVKAGVSELRALRGRMKDVPFSNHAEWRRVAAIVSGVASEWSVSSEGPRTPGPVGAFADAMGGIAQFSRGNSVGDGLRGPQVPNAGAVMRDVDRLPEREQKALLTELSKLGREVVKYAEQRGDTLKGGPAQVKGVGAALGASFASLDKAIKAQMVVDEDNELAPRNGLTMNAPQRRSHGPRL